MSEILLCTRLAYVRILTQGMDYFGGDHLYKVSFFFKAMNFPVLQQHENGEM